MLAALDNGVKGNKWFSLIDTMPGGQGAFAPPAGWRGDYRQFLRTRFESDCGARQHIAVVGRRLFVKVEGINPGLLGIRKVISEDALRKCAEAHSRGRRHRVAGQPPGRQCGAAARRRLDTPDTTIKPLYGHQEGGHRLQPEEAWTAIACVSHLSDGRTVS